MEGESAATDTLGYRTRKVSEEILKTLEKIESGESQASAVRLVIQSVKRLLAESNPLSISHGKFINLIDLFSEISPERKELIPAIRQIVSELLAYHTTQFHRFAAVHTAHAPQKPNYMSFRTQGIELGDIKGAVKDPTMRRKNWELKQDPTAKCEPKEETKK